MQPTMTYIGRWQATVTQWVALHPLFKVFLRDKGYEGCGSRREAWWRQEAIERQLRVALERISCEAKSRSRCGENATQ